MYKIKIQDLEQIYKALELADRGLTKGISTKNIRQSVSEAKKFIKNNYLDIKPNYL